MQLEENVIIAGRFRLNRLLGRGGMGSVWHATHLGLDIPCAVKFIEGAYANLGEAHARFEREAKAAAQLRSPHVVQILDHGIFEETPYIAMELLEGEDLGKRLDRLKRLPPSDVVGIVQQIARALGKAHGLGIVHRDLKPDNIYLVKDDDREIAKVLDFGIAKTKSTDLTSAKTRTGAMLGTPYYMSPEQAQGTRDVDTRSDLWSVGVIVFECLTGVRPFESEALGDLLIKILVLPIPVPSTLANVPPGFDAWWARAAARDPNERFQTAKDLADALTVVLGGVPDAALQGGTMPNAPRPAGGPSHHAVTPFGASPAAHTVAAPTPVPGITPAPFQPPAPQLARTTGGAISRTFDGTNVPPPAKRGPWIAIAAAGLSILALAGAGLGGRAYLRAHAAASAPPPQTAPLPVPTVDPALATPAANVDPPPPVADLPVVATAPTASAAAPAVPGAPHAQGGTLTPKPKPQGTPTSTTPTSTPTSAPSKAAGGATAKPASTDRAGF